MIKILPFLAASIALSMFSMPLKNNQPKEQTLTEEYEIYPIPHDIKYKDDVLTILDDVSIQYTSNIDEYTINRCFDILSLKDVRAYKYDSPLLPKDISYTKVKLLTSKDVDVSGDLAYITSKYDGYYLDIKGNEIEIIGKDSDAVYYGLASLEYIFNATKDRREVRQLTIKDYSDLKYRGFIEGFYGVPWTAEEREEMMRFGSKNKTNIYIYAPKDDQYHSALWRELYDTESLARLKEQIAEGNRTKTRLAWAIHPFINKPMQESTFEEDIKDALDKLEQIYNAGCRQFVVSGDDAFIEGCLMSDGTLASDYKEKNLKYAQMQNKALNIIAEWVKAKGDCYDLVFVPGAYCYDAEKALYTFNCEYYYKGLIYGYDGDVENCSTYLDETIEIMWTGNYVCSRLSGSKLDEFIELTNGRKPFIWMNYPVNDYSPSVIRIGPGEVYDEIYADSDEAKISGLVSNMMLEVEASKTSLFTASDYCWNTRDYDMNKSYVDAFKYVEPNTPESLLEICQHLRNTHAQFDNAHFEEAPELKQLINLFEEEYKTGNYSNSINKLNAYFEKLNYACDDFLTNGKNAKLIKEISAWVKSIKYGALAAINFLKVISKQYSYDESMFYKKQASNLYELNTHQTIKSPNVATYNVKYIDVTPGEKVLKPFLARLDELSSEVASLTGVVINLEKYPYSDELGEGTTALRYLGVNGKMDYMIDGDLSTSAYFLFTDWLYSFQFDLIFDYGSSRDISTFDLYQGADDRLWCYIEYSNDGVNYKRIPYVSNANKQLSFITDNNGLLDGEMTSSGYYRAIQNSHIELDEPINARYIKLKNYHSNCRVLIYEFVINGEYIKPKDIITFKGLTLKDGQDINNLLNGGSVKFESFVANEMILDYDLETSKLITDINVEFDEMYGLDEYQLLVSNDGYNFVPFDKTQQGQYRFVRLYSCSPTNSEVIINKLEVIYE